jgi:hypothetical protein
VYWVHVVFIMFMFNRWFHLCVLKVHVVLPYCVHHFRS